MDTQNQPPDLTLQLPRDVYHLVVFTLRGLLPPPETDTPEAEARRDRAAIARVRLDAAVQQRGGPPRRPQRRSRHLRDGLPPSGPGLSRHNAQAVSTERKAQSARSMLLRLQAERRKREADNATADKAAWSEHCAIGLMADALGHASPGRTPNHRHRRPPQPPEEPVPDPVAEADRYAVIYPQRAARIRALGLPQPCDFGPPPPELVDAIVTGTGPTLRALECLVSPTGTRDIDETSSRRATVRAQNIVLACRDVLPNPARRGALMPHA